MPALYERRAWIQIGAKRWSGLHVHFKVKKTLTAEPNPAEISVYNLSEASRAAIQAKDVPVILVAGYLNATEVIFAGDVRTVDHVKQGPDWITRMRAGDGEACVEKSYSVKSFAPGTQLTAVLGFLAGQMGVSVKDAVQKLSSGAVTPKIGAYLQGLAVQGRTVRELDRVTKAAGIEWSIQDGVLQILEPGKVTSDTAILLSEATGMVGSPDHGKPQKTGAPNYLKVKSLLNGGLRPGRAVRLVASQRSGDYRVAKVEHVGELDGQQWYSECSLLPWGSAVTGADSAEIDPELDPEQIP